jgi:hypothetical protein
MSDGRLLAEVSGAGLPDLAHRYRQVLGVAREDHGR